MRDRPPKATSFRSRCPAKDSAKLSSLSGDRLAHCRRCEGLSVTPEEEFQLLRETSAEVAAAVDAAFASLMERLSAGEVPREAVAAVMATFSGEYTRIYEAGLAVLMRESIGSASAVEVATSEIKLSQRLYTRSQQAQTEVQAVVDQHRRGFQDSRRLALEIFEGYNFRDPDEEPIKISKRNKSLPRYMRQALLTDGQLERGFSREFARVQVKNLKTAALRSAYEQVLKGVDDLEAGRGEVHLENKLKTAFYERNRQFARRISETELHRNFAVQQAREIMEDSDIRFVQWRLSPAHPVEDICDYFAGVDRYGLGPGVYPKALAPVAPAHPYCKCVLSPRLDLNDKEIAPRPDSEIEFFRRWNEDKQRLIAGSRKKLKRIRAGEDAWSVHNSKIDPIYQVKPAGSV